MTKTISFNELRKIKDCLPDGSMHKIADRLNINVQTVRNYFGGTNYPSERTVGFTLSQVLMGESLFWTTPQYMIWHWIFCVSKNSTNRK